MSTSSISGEVSAGTSTGVPARPWRTSCRPFQLSQTIDQVVGQDRRSAAGPTAQFGRQNSFGALLHRGTPLPFAASTKPLHRRYTTP